MSDVEALLQLELATLWVVGDGGRMERVNTPEPRPAPLLAVAAVPDTLVWACSNTSMLETFDAVTFPSR